MVGSMLLGTFVTLYVAVRRVRGGLLPLKVVCLPWFLMRLALFFSLLLLNFKCTKIWFIIYL